VFAGVLAIAAAASTLTVGNQPLSAKTFRLSSGEMLRLADLASQRGDVETETSIYEALSSDTDPNIRAEARYRRAKQLLTQKRTAEAAVLLRSVVDEKPDATGVRLELAGLLHELGEDDSALRQLRAARTQGLPPEVARLVDRYSEALRAMRPFGASIEIAIAPDSNINRSTRSDTLGTVLGDFQIDEESKASSGLGLALQGQAYRRLPLGATNHSLLFRGTLAGDLYRKSEFDDIALDFAAGPEFNLGKNRFNIEAAATQRWYGLQPYMRSARLAVSWIRPLGSRTQVQLIGSAGLADYQQNDRQDGLTFFGRGKVERALSPTTGVSLDLSVFRNSAKEPAYATTEWRSALLVWHDVGRATLTAEAAFGRLKADDRLILLPETRTDHFRSLSLGATFRRFSLGGYAPLARVTFERNKSTVEFYDYGRIRSEIGIVRAF
jgi:hypothetical protein